MIQLVNHRALAQDRSRINRMNINRKQASAGKIRTGLCAPAWRIQTGLLQLLFTVTNLLIVAQAASPAEAATLFADTVPEVVLVDVEDPQSIDYAQIQELRQSFPATPLVLLATRHRRGVLDRLYRMGVRGFVTEDVGLAGLVETIVALRANPQLFVVRIKS
jgi:two-component system, NarL family, response regulator DesR